MYDIIVFNNCWQNYLEHIKPVLHDIWYKLHQINCILIEEKWEKWRKITELVVESNSKIQFGQLKKIIYNINMLYDFYNALLISKKINLMIYDDVKWIVRLFSTLSDLEDFEFQLCFLVWP
jgi:hypothetical protein